MKSSVPVDTLVNLLSEQIVAFHPVFARIAQSTNAGIFLSQALYWYRREGKKDFAKSQREWEEYTSLTRYEQETARKKLRDLGVLEERNAPLEHKLYYRLNFEVLCRLLVANEPIPECSNPASPNDAPLHPLECSNPASQDKEEKEKEKKEEDIAKSPPPPISPPAGEAPSSSQKPMYEFATVRSFYPRHRWNEKKARAIWEDISPDREVAYQIVSCLSELVESRRWTNDHGEQVPWASVFLKGRQWEVEAKPPKNYKEAETIWNLFIEITGQNINLHSLSDHRIRMFSNRWEDALKKAEGHSPENATKLFEAAIQAYYDNHEEKKLKSLISPEKVFESTETFERWLGEACRED